MLSSIKIILLFIVLITSTGGFAREQLDKYTLSICSIFSNESPFIKEWIEYHKLVGVDHFYLYNNGSSDDYLNCLTPYLEKGLITLVNWPGGYGVNIETDPVQWAYATQIPAYEYAAKFQTLGKTKWLVFLDIDEFLVPFPKDGSLLQILKKHENHPGLILSSDFYNASKINTKKKLVIETARRTIEPKEKFPKRREKTIFQPALCVGFTWPSSRCIFKDHREPLVLDKSEMRINHYLQRGIYVKAKHLYPQVSSPISKEEFSHLLSIGFDLKDQEKIIYHFIPQLKRSL